MSEKDFIFRRERIADAWPEAIGLIKEHYAEIPIHGEREPNPDYDLYKAADETGILRLFAVRRIGKLVGYNIFSVSKDMHCKEMTVAAQQDLFVEKGSRGFGVRFMNWCDAALKKEGVATIYRTVTNHFDYAPALRRMNYELAGAVYCRRLH